MLRVNLNLTWFVVLFNDSNVSIWNFWDLGQLSVL